jgi:uncharacterized protein
VKYLDIKLLDVEIKMKSPESVVRGLYATLSGTSPEPLEHWVAPDVVLDVPGQSANSGRYEGFAAFVAFVGRAAALTDHTLKLTLHDVAVGADHVIAVATYTAQRPGRAPLENHLCHLSHVKDGRIVYSRFFTGDQYAVDAFWRA